MAERTRETPGPVAPKRFTPRVSAPMTQAPRAIRKRPASMRPRRMKNKPRATAPAPPACLSSRASVAGEARVKARRA